MVNKGLFTSDSGEWETPKWLFDKWNKKYEFLVDVCATRNNRKCNFYYNKAMNGLTQDWSKSNWMNPPYGRNIIDWVEKAHEEAIKGNLTIALLPARTDTKWFHDYIYNKYEIEFLKGRLKFSGSKNSAPFPSMIVIFYRNFL